MTHANDEHAVQELQLHIDNDSQTYFSITQPVCKNLRTKMARGTYDHEKAVKAWMHVAEQGAKSYHAEHGSFAGPKWHQDWPMAVRRTVAKQMADRFYEEASAGEHDHLLPKKYQPKG